MNKAEMIEKVQTACDGMSKAEADRVVNAVLDAIMGELKSGGKVTVAGFGTFDVRMNAARMGRNPKTGEAIQIKASKTPRFKAGINFKSMVN